MCQCQVKIHSMSKRVFSRAEWFLLFGVLACLSALGFGGFTLAFSLPQFTALQKSGLQREATVTRKPPYASVCLDRRCTPYALAVSFNASATNSIRIVIADLVVNQAEYNASQIGDSMNIIFLKDAPEKIWLARQVQNWSPWRNLLASGSLGLIGGFLVFSSRALARGKT
jgi:hypothetical protein